MPMQESRDPCSSDSDSDEEYQAQYRARLAAKLGKQSKTDTMWDELRRHLAKVDISELVSAAGSEVVRLTNVLPHSLATELHEVVQGAAPRVWQSEDLYTAQGDLKGFGHSFQAATPDSLRRSETVADENEDQRRLIEAFQGMCPAGMKHMVGCAAYDKGGHISKHDDGSSQLIDGVLWHRNIAFIYYLTPHWKREYGGLFVDYGVTSAPKAPAVEYVPLFNSLLAFRVFADGAHEHEVTPVLTAEARRFSVFGWFLTKEMPT